jgi:hypothetical protein
MAKNCTEFEHLKVIGYGELGVVFQTKKLNNTMSMEYATSSIKK